MLHDSFSRKRDVAREQVQRLEFLEGVPVLLSAGMNDGLLRPPIGQEKAVALYMDTDVF
jgi:hypothetical protein